MRRHFPTSFAKYRVVLAKDEQDDVREEIVFLKKEIISLAGAPQDKVRFEKKELLSKKR